MNYKHFNFLDVYYSFSDKCDDDFEVMAMALKIVGCKRKPNRIQKNLENISVDSTFRDYYKELMEKVDQANIETAKRTVKFNRLKKPRLF